MTDYAEIGEPTAAERAMVRQQDHDDSRLYSLMQPGRPQSVRDAAAHCLARDPEWPIERVNELVELTNLGAGSPAAPTAVTGVSAARAPAVSPVGVGEQLTALVDRLRAEQPHERTYDQRLADLELSVALLASIAAGPKPAPEGS